jgi:hypothetical protein
MLNNLRFSRLFSNLIWVMEDDRLVNKLSDRRQEINNNDPGRQKISNIFTGINCVFIILN